MRYAEEAFLHVEVAFLHVHKLYFSIIDQTIWDERTRLSTLRRKKNVEYRDSGTELGVVRSSHRPTRNCLLEVRQHSLNAFL